MLRRPTHFRPFLWTLAAAALAVGVAGGCTSWGRWGARDDAGFSDEDRKLTEGVRPREPNASFWSTSTKGKQVERNLGIGGE